MRRIFSAVSYVFVTKSNINKLYSMHELMNINGEGNDFSLLEDEAESLPAKFGFCAWCTQVWLLVQVNHFFRNFRYYNSNHLLKEFEP